jgi:hypothetical protein
VYSTLKLDTVIPTHLLLFYLFMSVWQRTLIWLFSNSTQLSLVNHHIMWLLLFIQHSESNKAMLCIWHCSELSPIHCTTSILLLFKFKSLCVFSLWLYTDSVTFTFSSVVHLGDSDLGVEGTFTGVDAVRIWT